MYCVGEHCTSCILASCSADKGITVFRIQRNDAIINEMIHWLKQFVNLYVSEDQKPESNFFFEEERYRTFLHSLNAACTSASQFVRIMEHNIQRGPEEPKFLEE